MKTLPRGLAQGVLLGVVHVLLVAGVGGRLLLDRWRYPRVWARAAAFDPELPVRGRYVRLRVEVRQEPRALPGGPAALTVEGDELVARSAARDEGVRVVRGRNGTATLAEPVAYFIPEDALDPTQRAAGEELWVELTVPRVGPPRPLRLGVKQAGSLVPLDLE